MTLCCLLSGLTCLALISHADEAAPLQLVGTTQIDRSFTAYLREDGGEHVFTLGEGETANGWQISQTTRDAGGNVVRIHLQRDSTTFWLGVSGTAPTNPETVTAEKPDSKPLIDVPGSQRGPLQEQALHRSRLKHKPEARKAHRRASDLDPFPTKLAPRSR
jgi:YD repeat-containing protein